MSNNPARRMKRKKINMSSNMNKPLHEYPRDHEFRTAIYGSMKPGPLVNALIRRAIDNMFRMKDQWCGTSFNGGTISVMKAPTGVEADLLAAYTEELPDEVQVMIQKTSTPRKFFGMEMIDKDFDTKREP